MTHDRLSLPSDVNKFMGSKRKTQVIYIQNHGQDINSRYSQQMSDLDEAAKSQIACHVYSYKLGAR